MNKNIILAGIGVFVLLGIVFLISKNKTAEVQKDVSQSSVETQSSSAVSNAKTYTMTDVAKHAKDTDCWTVVDGVIYDLSAFITQGKASNEHCKCLWKEGTELFNTRGAKNMPHPEKIKKYS